MYRTEVFINFDICDISLVCHIVGHNCFSSLTISGLLNWLEAPFVPSLALANLPFESLARTMFCENPFFRMDLTFFLPPGDSFKALIFNENLWFREATLALGAFPLDEEADGNDASLLVSDDIFNPLLFMECQLVSEAFLLASGTFLLVAEAFLLESETFLLESGTFLREFETFLLDE